MTPLMTVLHAKGASGMPPPTHRPFTCFTAKLSFTAQKCASMESLQNQRKNRLAGAGAYSLCFVLFCYVLFCYVVFPDWIQDVSRLFPGWIQVVSNLDRCWKRKEISLLGIKLCRIPAFGPMPDFRLLPQTPHRSTGSTAAPVRRSARRRPPRKPQGDTLPWPPPVPDPGSGKR